MANDIYRGFEIERQLSLHGAYYVVVGGEICGEFKTENDVMRAIDQHKRAQRTTNNHGAA